LRLSPAWQLSVVPGFITFGLFSTLTYHLIGFLILLGIGIAFGLPLDFRILVRLNSHSPAKTELMVKH
jgi:hypothetical protein